MRILIDTSVLAYAEGVGDDARCRKAREVVSSLPMEDVLIPVQVLGELYRVLTGKGKRKATQARAAVHGWAVAFDVVDSTWLAMENAMKLAARHGLSIWDALIVAAGVENECALLISEDLQHGFTWKGLTVVNPFLDELHPLLQGKAEGG